MVILGVLVIIFMIVILQEREAEEERKRAQAEEERAKAKKDVENKRVAAIKKSIKDKEDAAAVKIHNLSFEKIKNKIKSSIPLTLAELINFQFAEFKNINSSQNINNDEEAFVIAYMDYFSELSEQFNKIKKNVYVVDINFASDLRTMLDSMYAPSDFFITINTLDIFHQDIAKATLSSRCIYSAKDLLIINPLYLKDMKMVTLFKELLKKCMIPTNGIKMEKIVIDEDNFAHLLV